MNSFVHLCPSASSVDKTSSKKAKPCVLPPGCQANAVAVRSTAAEARTSVSSAFLLPPLDGEGWEGVHSGSARFLLLRLASGISSPGEAARNRAEGAASVRAGLQKPQAFGASLQSSVYSLKSRLHRGSLPQFPLVRQPPCAFDRSPSGDGRKASAGSRTHCQTAPAGRHDDARPEQPRCTRGTAVAWALAHEEYVELQAHATKPPCHVGLSP